MENMQPTTTTTAATTTTATTATATVSPIVQQAVEEDELLKLVRDDAMKLPDTGIAISGMAGRFPKADSINEYEEHLRRNLDMVNDQDSARFSCGLWGLPPRAGRLKDLSRFDSEFFGFTPEEANYIDFQMRILYEVVYESILDAGVNPAELRGTNTGVFFGLHCNEFENAMADDPAFKSNGYYAQFAVKVAQYFDFRGLTVAFDAACASGFVGFHNAVQAMEEGLVEQAIVCSSNIPIHPTGSFIFLQMQMLSPTGYSRFLDSRADGYVKSEACVSILLQRKHLARRNYASIVATMTSVDGHKPEGITFPSFISQERLIRSTKELARVSTNQVEYIEAHGTGTPAGDPQEARAISNVYFGPEESDQCNVGDARRNQQREARINYDENGAGGPGDNQDRRLIGPLLVGSVKTNMGHSEAASGLCALAKVALMLENELIYASLHYDHPNTNIKSLMDGRLKFVDKNRRLRAKIVPLSCYGFGGSNVHVIIRANHREAIGFQRLDYEEAMAENSGNNSLIIGNEGGARSPLLSATQLTGLPRLVVMFGRSEQAIDEFFNKVVRRDTYNLRHCMTDDFLALVDSLSVSTIDRLMDYRGYLIVDGHTGRELARSIARCQLAAGGAQQPDGRADQQQQQQQQHDDLGRRPHHQECRPRACNFILPGVGCQWSGMGAGLVGVKPFWSTIERLAATLAELDDGLDLAELVSSDTHQRLNSCASMRETFVAIVGYEIALINLVAKSGLNIERRGAIVGHSLGELACAYAAGLLNESQAIRVAYEMGKTLDDNWEQIRGSMLAVAVSHARANQAISECAGCTTVQVSCVNGAESVTLSGPSHEIDTIGSHLARRGELVQRLEIPVALHNSKMMNADIRAKLRSAIGCVLPASSVDAEPESDWLSSVAPEENTRPQPEAAMDEDEGEAPRPSRVARVNADYFVSMLTRRVDFFGALSCLPADSVAFELGPSNLFEPQVRQCLAELEPEVEPVAPVQRRRRSSAADQPSRRPGASKFHYVAAMRRATPAGEQALRLAAALGQVYQAGASMNLTRLYHGDERRLFPVRRQTPSLSSLINWNHEATLFVPRYPIQFSKSSAKCEVPVDLLNDRDKYLSGHAIEGRVLFPATGYLFLIWRVFSFTRRKIYDACFHDVEHELLPVEFRNVRLLRAVMLSQRGAQLYVHFEEATGKFQVKEGGSVVVEGQALAPSEQPNGLLYGEVRERIRRDSPELVMNKDDVYRQFRVSGYDYGDSFQNVVASSQDGRHCRVSYNGHFTAFTDSILQSIFLAVSQYAPSGGLFLPTRFEYVRFQPEMILQKLRECQVPFDQSDGSLSTLAKRDTMSKMMQRATAGNSASFSAEPGAQGQQEQATEGESPAPNLPECIFDVYCDPVTGVIISDGIEMRGIKATPAPRRLDTNDVLLESYQFVADIEEPVDDEPLTRFESIKRPYARACDSMSVKLIEKLCALDSAIVKQTVDQLLDGVDSGRYLMTDGELEAYKRLHLACVHTDSTVAAKQQDTDHEASEQQGNNCAQDSTEQSSATKTKQESGQSDYDIRKNGPRALMSVYDQWLARDSRVLTPKLIRSLVQENRKHLLNDLIQATFTCERFVRPLIETVVENACAKKSKLRLVEINYDDALMHAAMQQLVGQIEPNLTLDYSLAHPDPNRLGSIYASKTPPSGAQQQQQIKTMPLKDLSRLFADHQLRELDLIIFKDISCYSLPKLVVEQNGLASVMSTLSAGLREGGYVLVAMRRQLTLAERVLLAFGEPELVGLSKQHLDRIRQQRHSKQQANGELARAAEKIRQINAILASRCGAMLAEAKRNHMLCLARKLDSNGCCLMLFRRKNATLAQTTREKRLEKDEPLVLRVRHDKLDWLDTLRANFKLPQEEDKATEHEGQAQVGPQATGNQCEEPDKSTADGTASNGRQRRVWMCAVATRQNPISGVVGMMQALRKELGSANLRCFYDAHTFRDKNEPVGEAEIESSDHFAAALARNQIWYCVDSLGRPGSYRHLTINEYVSPEACLCDKQLDPKEPDDDTPAGEAATDVSQGAVVGAYVNNVTRGDLSSFAWYEAPFKHLDEQQRSQLVRVAYSALNFRDIMLATGRLPLDAIPTRLAMADCLLGLEFSGWNAEGQRVMGMVYGRGMATHVVCPRDHSIVVPIPSSLSLDEAATIPVVYATAIMALVYRGRMQRGESILIHAGSGGVGQAAIRLALHHGLSVYTTVGSEEKRHFLLEEFGPSGLKADNIFNSRDCGFEPALMRATRGAGVDLVLNSLADDKLQASIRCLRAGGRFLEIGKYDMSVDAPLELLALDTNKTFHGILLDKLFDVDDIGAAFKHQLACVLDTLKRGLDEGFVRPIKYKLFKRTQIEQAFRYMATGKHIGKVLVEIRPPPTQGEPRRQLFPSPMEHVRGLRCVPRAQFSSQKAYIVTGGLGGFGMELAKWLVNQGARHLLLTSRSGLRTGYQRATVMRLEGVHGARVLVVDQATADATRPEGALKLCRMACDMAPNKQLGGIFHLAMVLKDTLLDNMSQEDFEQVCAPKVDACQHLDVATRQLESRPHPASWTDSHRLDYFVAFSSVTSGKGNAGQANYAYANSCLERICERRRLDGLHGLAIQWGAIGDVGVAFENLGGNDVIIGGTMPQRLPSCLDTLAKLLSTPFATCLSVLPVKRAGAGGGERGDLVAAIMHVLGIKDSSKVSEEASLGELGLDSLMAVEIRQYIEREYDLTLNIHEIRSLTIAKIREISESERLPPDSKPAPGHEKQVKEASSYGTNASLKVQQQDLLQSKPIAANNHQQVEFPAANGECDTIDRSKQFEASVNSRMVAAFVPQLILPNDDICWLNKNGRNRMKTATNHLDQRPIFFMPPIHGRFDALEQVCANIQRPCIGINWTCNLARAKTMQEAVETYIDILGRAHQQITGPTNGDEKDAELRVDLVGYSFGATVAFELMSALHKFTNDPRRQTISNEIKQAKRATENGTKMTTNSYGQRPSQHLLPGRLVLLDGSPKQIELGSKYLSSLTEKKSLKLSDKANELLMVYVMSHARLHNCKLDYGQLQSQLRSFDDVRDKVKFASAHLVDLLYSTSSGVFELNKHDLTNGHATKNTHTLYEKLNGTGRHSESMTGDTLNRLATKRTQVAMAMEAFCRRYEIISSFKAQSRLPDDCTLIRAKQLYLTSKDNYNQDLDLASVVDGKVHLHILDGDHETFLTKNKHEVARLIGKY